MTNRPTHFAEPLETFERRLAALLTELDSPGADAEAIAARAESCAVAFEAVRAAGGDATAKLDENASERIRGLLASALQSARREHAATAARLKLARQARRGMQRADSSTEVGDSCDVAG